MTTAFLLAVIAALTIICAFQVAAAIRAKRLQAEVDRKTGRAIGELIGSLLKSGTVAIAKAHKRGYVEAIVDMTKAVIGDSPRSRNDLDTILFGGSFSPRDRFTRTFTAARPTANDPFSIENLIAALSDKPRYGVGKGRFADLAMGFGKTRTAAHISPDDVSHIKDAGSADPLADTVRHEFGVNDTGAAVPLTETDPVELTAAHQVAGDGGVATEAEANAESRATPLPADFALKHPVAHRYSDQRGSNGENLG